MHPTSIQTHPPPRPVYSLRLLVLVAALTVACSLMGIAQDSLQISKDPLHHDPHRRASARLPVSFGLLLKLDVMALAAAVPDHGSHLAEDTNTLNDIPGISIDFYYDAWQIGFHRRIYGNMLRVTMRDIGRDVHSGRFVEAGWLPGEPDSLGNITATTIIAGFGFNGEPRLVRGRLDLGFSYGYTAGMWQQGECRAIYFQIEAGLWSRLAISDHGVTAGLRGRFGWLPGSSTYIGLENQNGFGSLSSIHADARFGLNFLN